MNAMLKDILERALTWPEAAQQQAVELLLALEQEYAQPYELTDEDKAAIDRSVEEAQQGRFASDAEVQAVFGRLRRR